MTSTDGRLESTDPPPAKCIVCGRTSRIAGLIGSDVCSPTCAWREVGAAEECERIVELIDRLYWKRDDNGWIRALEELRASLVRGEHREGG